MVTFNMQKPGSDIRLQKFLALCGAGSRRACEGLIAEGRVTVDGKTVASQGLKISPGSQIVEIDGNRAVPEPKITLLFNKPRDVLCTSADPKGRKTFLACLPKLPARVFTVGRLDRASEGLLLITSDGELAQLISHPRNMVEKTYLAAVGRALTAGEEKRLREGIYSEGERLRMADLAPVERQNSINVYKVKIHEGKNRHIRRMFAGLNLEVKSLKRVAIGPLKLGNLRVGQWRYLTGREMNDLRQYIAGRAGRNLETFPA